MANMDQFEAYFRRADLDGDGRISGAEAVAFFQGSNLSKLVLAQIWTIADKSHTGFLNRQEFYNALKLVTVAQSKRDLTPDIVQAALYGPASTKIPPPQISLPATPASQFNSAVPSSAPQMGAVTPTSSQNLGFRGQAVPSAGMNQSYFAPHQSQSLRPSQPMQPFASRPPQSTSGLEFPRGGGVVSASGTPSANISNDWPSGKAGGLQTGPRGLSPSVSSVASRPQSVAAMPSQSVANDSKALMVSGNGFASDSVFGGDMFSSSSTTQKKETSLPNYTANSLAASSAIVPVSTGTQASAKPSSLDSLQSTFSMQPSSSRPAQQVQSALSQSLQVSAQGSSPVGAFGTSVGVGNSSSDSSQHPWPKMKPSDVQKYTKVFMEVDTDRDGKISGEQARNLFLSWRLPRDILKQVWDLSDQDSDSMLSLREFCFALYLMERYREGRPLPPTLPSSVMYDQTLLSMVGQPRVAYGNAAWGISPGYGQQQQGVQGNQPAGPVPGLRPPAQANAPSPAGGATKSNEQKSGALVLDDSFLNQSQNGDRTSADVRSQDASGVKKAVEPEKVILDSREKMEYYRTMMQELVLYKSRCDNRLNEITERALADKREAESLAKKYEEKYKQIAELASKLTIEEATFRDIQERKTELQQAIVKVEQGGSADGLLQVRADRIQSHLEELVKALNERCKKHGLEVKSAAVIELPIGWQPGFQEGAAVWDEEWDKFEDEGFASEITVDGKVVSVAANPKSAAVGEDESANGSVSPGSSFFDDRKPGFSSSAHAMGGESVYAHSEDDFGRYPQLSPTGRTDGGSPFRESSEVHFDKNTDVDAETHKGFDEPTWGAFDNDDVDSVWGFNPSKEYDNHEDFFGQGDYGVDPIRTVPPGADGFYQRKGPIFEDSVPSTPMSMGADSFYQRKSPIFEDSVPSTPMSKFGGSDSFYQRKSPIFEDSVPSTPMSKFGDSSPRYSDADHFDRFSRFDSFSTHDGGFSQPEKLNRFDSINSSKDFSHGFSRFDSMSSSRDFGSNPAFSRFDSISSSRDFGQTSQLSRFDSINSSKDFGGRFSFDDADPFGSSGPFKASSDNNSPKKSSDNWRSF